MAKPGWGEVPNGPLREAVLAEIGSGRETWTSLCRRIGWVEPRGNAETSRLKRTLGLSPWASKGYRSITTHVAYGTTLTICRALDADPVDFGL